MEDLDNELVAAHPQVVQQELVSATTTLSSYGLLNAQKWAAECLSGLIEEETPGLNPPSTEPVLWALSKEEEAAQASELIHLTLAKSYFDLKEYRRAAQVLSSNNTTSAKATYLQAYSLYLAGERRKEEETLELTGSLERSDITNNELPVIHTLLLNPSSSSSSSHSNTASTSTDTSSTSKIPDHLDTWGLYILGVVLREMDAKQQAMEAFAAAVTQYPLNWAAWYDLSGLITSMEVLATLSLPSHWTRVYFYGTVYLALQHNEAALDLWATLAEKLFPGSRSVQAQLGMAHYNMRDFSAAEARFSALHQTDPHGLEHADTYSNILFVHGDKAALAYLAQTTLKTDKYRPETCCVIGNYYSIKGAHEKAVLYFKRALALDKNFLSAWTLMGHEFLELQNPPAAIESYRRAVDINPRDYRAWYGLGQTYELMRMHLYAQYYFKKATALRPYDARMWTALAHAYEALGKPTEQIKCLKQAEANDDREGLAILKLAQVYRSSGRPDAAANYYAKVLARHEEFSEGEGSGESAQSVEALLFLAEWLRKRDSFEEAENYCLRALSSYDLPEATKLLAEIRAARMAAAV